MIRAKRNPKKKKWSWEDLSRALHSSTAQCVYIFLAGTAVLCLLLMLAVTPQRYNLKVGDIAPNTITASKDVVDELSTEQRRREAAAQVTPTTAPTATAALTRVVTGATRSWRPAAAGARGDRRAGARGDG